MTTKIYGASDDLIEFEGDVYGESGGGDEPALVILSDGTLLEIKYGKADMGVWSVVPVKAGALFDRVDPCFDDDADPYSDVAHFYDGLTWAYVAREWERVK